MLFYTFLAHNILISRILHFFGIIVFMDKQIKKVILEASGAHDLFEIEKIQDLWSGYGQIVRYGLRQSSRSTIVLKHIRLPKQSHHPRGWNTDLSHRRKVRSYEVEVAWYRRWSKYCHDQCRIPKCLAYKQHGGETWIVLEDLNNAGFEERRRSVSLQEMKVCLSWLANFHATFMNEKPEGLWDTGTYWHLETRPEELEALKDTALKNAAQRIDQKLQESPYQTFVHGDAKLANFCFSQDGQKVAAVDFQYVGGGCGMKDLAYFVGSCLQGEECEKVENEILDHYFAILREALKNKDKEVDIDKLEANWRVLYPVAWTDFHRFIKGWSPGHWKINSYSERMARKVLESL